MSQTRSTSIPHPDHQKPDEIPKRRSRVTKYRNLDNQPTKQDAYAKPPGPFPNIDQSSKHRPVKKVPPLHVRSVNANRHRFIINWKEDDILNIKDATPFPSSIDRLYFDGKRIRPY
ncbi:unnamed protein product [Enterobius vermicularis]|uniref:Chromo domain-containing protein n=1 Tax=Enterobius vermicularis TaxID=51028 RepID=A0A0N4V0K2_ENTVE|nr:unnamed protein product [Enterobius vermicularis]